jgi:CTP synthase
MTINNNLKYIFITGGVVSGLGKGIFAASLGYLLKSSGFSVDVIKMDPYLNIDPGTMSPYEHGEVFVLSDGGETDLDLGHYERFLNTELKKYSSISSGGIYNELLNREREGKYLGKTVQLIPNVTNLIQEKFQAHTENIQIRLIEIGGSTGDMEGEIFLESLRQFRQKQKGNIMHFHLGYIPFLQACKEYKTKPMQNSIRELLRLGLQPDSLVLRYEPKEGQLFNGNITNKMCLFGNISPQEIICLPDVSSIYEVPKYLLDNTQILASIKNILNLELKPQISTFYQDCVKKFEQNISIAIIAKYSQLDDSYYSVIESIKAASFSNHVNYNIEILDAEDKQLLDKMKNYDGFIVPGGFGNRGMEGKIKAIEWIRVNKKPFLGICLGLQLAVIEYLRNVCKLEKSISSEMFTIENQNDLEDLENKYEVAISYMNNQLEQQNTGASMRLGSYNCQLNTNSLAYSLYNQEKVIERHRHRLEVQNKYVDILEKHGLSISGKHYLNQNTDKKINLKQDFLVEIVELNTKDHPYFIATQSHPEFLSRPDRPHPLFMGLISACKK